MKLRSGKNIRASQLPSSIKKEKATLADKRKPCAPLNAFKVIPEFREVPIAHVKVIQTPPLREVRIQALPPQDLAIPPPPPPQEVRMRAPPPQDLEIPPPPLYDDMNVPPPLQDRNLRTPPLPQHLQDGINLSADYADAVCGALQRYTRIENTIPVRSWKKYSEKSSPYILPGQVMRKWLRHVLISGMSWTFAIRQIPLHQKDLARRIMLELHADLYRFS